MRGTILLTVALATCGMAAAPLPGEATGHCPPSAGSTSTPLRRVGVPEEAPGSWGARLSGDGRYVAFVSYQDDLVDGDTDAYADVFRVDRARNEIVQVSVDLDDLGGHGHAAEASISEDGTRVAFSSPHHVYLRDLSAARTVLVSVNDAGAAADQWSGTPVIDPGGGLVAFTSRATNLVASDRRSESIEAYLRDLEAGTTERISLGAGGLSAPTWSWAEAVSEEGRYVAFTSGWSERSLSSNDGYPGSDVFLRDRQTQTTELVSVGPDGRSMGGWFLGMSADGMRILFGSGPQPDSKPAVYLRDRKARTTDLIAPLVTSWRRRASTKPAPLAFVKQRTGPPATLSADGNIAGLQTALPTGRDDTNGADDIVLVDLATRSWRPASLSASGCPANGASGEPVLSGDGSAVAFTSEADDIAGPDNHRVTNVYLRDMIAGHTQRISTAPSPTRS